MDYLLATVGTPTRTGTMAASPSRLATRCAAVAVLLLWTVVAWAGWNYIGLNSDGSFFVASIVSKGGFTSYGDYDRLYAIALSQAPMVLALRLGVTDLEWIARIYSWTTLGFPALVYTAALMRARRDETVQALVTAAIAAIFLPSCLFSVGEYNLAYAAVIAAAVWIVTARGPSVADACVLLLLGILCLRAYEGLLYLGPLVAALVLRSPPPVPPALSAPGRAAAAAMVLPVVLAAAALLLRQAFPLVAVVAVAGFGLWAWRFPDRAAPLLGAIPYGIAALFLVGSVFAAGSARFADGAYSPQGVLWDTIRDNLALFNPQFLLATVTVVLVAAAITLRNRSLASVGLLGMVGLALLPALQDHGTGSLPLSYLHYQVRQFCGLLTAAFLVLLLFRGRRRQSAPEWSLVLGLAALVAVLPSTLHAAGEWGDAVHALQDVVASRSGVVAYRDLPAGVKRWYAPEESQAEFLPGLSRLLRRSPRDGLVLDLRPLRPGIVVADESSYLLPIADRYAWHR